MQLHIGIDDTDSPRGGCTTYIAALLVERILALGAEFTDYPFLIRLNPNVPWKTRGNGAICLRIEVSEDLKPSVLKHVSEIVQAKAYLDDPDTNPGIVVHQGEIPPQYKAFSSKAITGVVTLEHALELAEKNGSHVSGLNGGTGIIGALAAIGEDLHGDHTYELLAYRVPENYGRPRQIDGDSVLQMDRALSGYTYNSIDPETGRILITPRGPDPVLLGIRGESPEAVLSGYNSLDIREPVERWVIFRTNQGTDAHLTGLSAIAETSLYFPASIEGSVQAPPKTIAGGHVLVKIVDSTGQMECAAYEPTGTLRFIVRKLIPGDIVRVHGGVKPSSFEGRPTLNIEKIEIVRLAEKHTVRNPSCPACRGSMESMGRDQGYRCRKCGFRDADLKKEKALVPRGTAEGLYLASPKAQRHLTKPLQRYGKERSTGQALLSSRWHWP